MTKDIKIAGHSINNILKIKGEILKDANQFCSDGIAQITKFVAEIVDAEDVNSVQALSDNALELFENITRVAQAANITLYLPYDTEYGSDEVLSCIIDNHIYGDGSEFRGIHSLGRFIAELESVESGSRQWYSSNC